MSPVNLRKKCEKFLRLHYWDRVGKKAENQEKPGRKPGFRLDFCAKNRTVNSS
jgi:hypothetical protein